MTSASFNGFSNNAMSFLKSLKANNNRAWFAENKKTYEAEIKSPAAAFCDLMSMELKKTTGIPHKSKLFRVHRDVRFSKDKTPYNSHIHISFTPESNLKSPPMWFFGLDTQSLAIGCGVFGFEKPELERFRKRVVGEEGAAIAKTLASLEKKGMRLTEPHLKRVPNEYPKDHPQGDLLRYKGLAVWQDFDDTQWVTKPDMVKTCLKEFKRLTPMFDLLIGN